MLYKATCPSCETSYKLRPEVRGGDSLVIQCAVCKHKIEITKRKIGGLLFPRVKQIKHDQVSQ